MDQAKGRELTPLWIPAAIRSAGAPRAMVRFTATADGVLTVEALFDHGGGDVDLQITDADGQVLGGGSSSDDNERVDLTVTLPDGF